MDSDLTEAVKRSLH